MNHFGEFAEIKVFTRLRRQRARILLVSRKSHIDGNKTYVVRSGNSDTVLEWMPAHMKDLLVEIDLICIGLLPHTCTLTRRTSSPTSSFLCTIRARCVDWSWYTDLFSFESRFVSLQNDFGLLFRIRGIDHEVVVVGPGHDVASIAREDYFKFVKNAVIFIGVT